MFTSHSSSRFVAVAGLLLCLHGAALAAGDNADSDGNGQNFLSNLNIVSWWNNLVGGGDDKPTADVRPSVALASNPESPPLPSDSVPSGTNVDQKLGARGDCVSKPKTEESLSRSSSVSSTSRSRSRRENRMTKGKKSRSNSLSGGRILNPNTPAEMPEHRDPNTGLMRRTASTGSDRTSTSTTPRTNRSQSINERRQDPSHRRTQSSSSESPERN